MLWLSWALCVHMSSVSLASLGSVLRITAYPSDTLSGLFGLFYIVSYGVVWLVFTKFVNLC
jgi:hypothetical protein